MSQDPIFISDDGVGLFVIELSQSHFSPSQWTQELVRDSFGIQYSDRVVIFYRVELLMVRHRKISFPVQFVLLNVLLYVLAYYIVQFVLKIWIFMRRIPDGFYIEPWVEVGVCWLSFELFM